MSDDVDPKVAEMLAQIKELLPEWWYYSFELLPGVFAKGTYAPDLPMLPRMMLRNCQLEGMSCLDMGSMEGLIPILMRKGGADQVLAVDAVDHCLAKMNVAKACYGVDFEYKSIGLMYELFRKLAGRSFDLINCSGLLYHVYSPLQVLAGVRPLLKRNGMMIVSTNVILEDGYSMTFNAEGTLQGEANTFWYTSVPMLDYMLRLMRLTPIETLYFRRDQFDSIYQAGSEKQLAYMSVLCQASDTASDDPWMSYAARASWEYQGNTNWPMADAQPESKISRRDGQPISRINLWDVTQQTNSVSSVSEHDSHGLLLSSVD